MSCLSYFIKFHFKFQHPYFLELIEAVMRARLFKDVLLPPPQVAEGRQEELTHRGALEKKELELRIEEMEEKEQVLQARIEALQADNDFTNERLAALQGARSDSLSANSPLGALTNPPNPAGRTPAG